MKVDQLNISSDSLWSNGLRTIKDIWMSLCLHNQITLAEYMRVSRLSHLEQQSELMNTTIKYIINEKKNN